MAVPTECLQHFNLSSAHGPCHVSPLTPKKKASQAYSRMARRGPFDFEGSSDSDDGSEPPGADLAGNCFTQMDGDNASDGESLEFRTPEKIFDKDDGQMQQDCQSSDSDFTSPPKRRKRLPAPRAARFFN